MQKSVISFLLLLVGTALLYTAVQFSAFEPNAFQGNGDLLNAIFKTIQIIFGLVVDIYGILPFFRKELPALSITPDTAKLSLDLPLIGRLDDLSWLQNKNGDKVLVGQPGSGKTFLLYKFAMQGECLFVNDYNLKRVTSEYRRKRPKIIIIDDGNIHLEFISGLTSYRKRKSATFEILVSCWPSHEADVLSTLNIPSSSAHYLNLLTLDHLVEVVKAVSVGWEFSDGLIQEIVEQSVGRPGLAVVLTELCLKEDGVRDIVLGDALAKWVTTKLPLAPNNENASAILAGFSVGGSMGMPMSAVAKGLGLNLLEVQSVTSKLVGGLIFDKAPNLVVYPPALRHSLVRDIFFRGAVSLSIVEFIKNAPSLQEVAKTLIGARRRGANIPQEFLLEILVQLNSSELWEEFAYLGQSEATWVLENKPQFLITIAHPSLLNAPDKVIPLLLSAAIGDDRELHSSTDHPVRIIQDWVLSAYDGKGQAIRRRKILLDSVIAWINGVETPKPGIRALQIIMTPEYFVTSTSPGSGDKVTWGSGHLSALEIDSLKKYWPNVLAIINKTSIQDWAPIRQIIETWAYPGRLSSVLPETYEDMISFASQMILDLLPTISKHAGLLHWAHHVARTVEMSISVPVDATFEILYPDVDISDFHTDSTRQIETVIKLAQSWSTKNPGEVMKELIQIEKEAQLIEGSWPRLTPLLCLEISKKVGKQNIWIEAGVKEGMAGDLVMPFLNRAIEIKERGWIGKVRQWLQEPNLKPHIIGLVLTTTEMPKELLNEVYSKLENLEGEIKFWCLRGEIPEDRILRLLKHDNPKIALAAAKGEWHADPAKKVRTLLNNQWEQVIINFLSEDYLLGEIFTERPTLALAWLSARIQEAAKDKYQIAGYRLERAFEIAANSLKFEERQSLLRTTFPFSYDYLIVTPLIRDSIELYQELLLNKNMKHLHLYPLYGKPTDSWVLRVMAATNAGYTAKEIAHATMWENMRFVWQSGKESEIWTDWVNKFEPYLLHAEERIREVARISIDNASSSRDRALRKELQEAVFGRNY